MNTQSFEQTVLPHVLLLDCDTLRREQLATVLRERGFTLSVKSHIAEIERWPVGQIVVVDAERFTPWWGDVGAALVVVLSGTTDDDSVVYKGVQYRWLPRGSGPDALLAVL